MTLAENTFKAAIREGRTQLGIWSSLCSPIVAELLAQSGFDWVLFDAEHSPVEIAGLLPLLQAAGNGTARPIVRPLWNDPVLIKRVLDIGAQTILLPFVQTPEAAAQALRSVRYPPEGRRGVSGATRASGYGRTTNYLARAAEMNGGASSSALAERTGCSAQWQLTALFKTCEAPSGTPGLGSRHDVSRTDLRVRY